MKRSAQGDDVLDLKDRRRFTDRSPGPEDGKLEETSWGGPSTDRRFTTRVIFGIIAAVVLGAAGAGIWLATSAHRAGETADQGAADQPLAPEPTAAEIQAAIETTVRGYMEATNDLERCRWVVAGDDLITTMGDFYQRPGVKPPRGFNRILKIAPAAFDGFPMHMVIAAEPDEKTAHMLSVFPVGGNMLIDWESSVTLGEQSWREFLTLKPTHPTQMRVYLQRGNYYNFAFADESLWDNYETTSRGQPDKLQAYVKSGSELARHLYFLIPPKAIQPVNIRLQWADEGRALVITELLHNHWVDVDRLRKLASKAEAAPKNVGPDL